MKTILALVLMAAAPALASAQATKEDLKKLARAGISEDVILAYIRTNGFQQRLSTDDLVELKSAGLGDKVLAALNELAGEVLAPLNRTGDLEGARLENGIVRTPSGFADAYRQFVAGGWNGAPFAAEHGGQDLPWALSTALSEIWSSANLAFSLCPLLTQGAIDPSATPIDYAAANQGQAKRLAGKAYDELQARLPGGAATSNARAVARGSNTG